MFAGEKASYAKKTYASPRVVSLMFGEASPVSENMRQCRFPHLLTCWKSSMAASAPRRFHVWHGD